MAALRPTDHAKYHKRPTITTMMTHKNRIPNTQKSGRRMKRLDIDQESLTKNWNRVNILVSKKANGRPRQTMYGACESRTTDDSHESVHMSPTPTTILRPHPSQKIAPSGLTNPHPSHFIAISHRILTYELVFKHFPGVPPPWPFLWDSIG